LVTINGEPLIDILVRRLVANGFRRVWITTHYLAQDIKEHLSSGEHLGAEIQYITEREPLGTAGAVHYVPVPSSDTPILVCNADNLHTIDLGALTEYHSKSGAWMTLAVTKYVTEVPFGVVEIENGLIGNLVEKPRRSYWVATGVSVLTKRALSLFPSGQRLDIPWIATELLNRDFPAAAFKTSGYWSDVGDHQSLERVRNELNIRSPQQG